MTVSVNPIQPREDKAPELLLNAALDAATKYFGVQWTADAEQKLQEQKAQQEKDLAETNKPAKDAEALSKNQLSFDTNFIGVKDGTPGAQALKRPGEETARLFLPKSTFEKGMELDYRKFKDSADRVADNSKKNPTNFDDKIKGLNSADKGRFDNLVMASKAVEDMDGALKGGSRTFSLFGDNDYTLAQGKFSEALGRLQSGGAISKDEEKRFAKMAPTYFDSPEIKTKKINDLKDELGSRLATLGFKHDEIPTLVNRAIVVKPQEGTAVAAPQIDLHSAKDADLDKELERLRKVTGAK